MSNISLSKGRGHILQNIRENLVQFSVSYLVDRNSSAIWSSFSKLKGRGGLFSEAAKPSLIPWTAVWPWNSSQDSPIRHRLCETRLTCLAQPFWFGSWGRRPCSGRILLRPLKRDPHGLVRHTSGGWTVTAKVLHKMDLISQEKAFMARIMQKLF